MKDPGRLIHEHPSALARSLLNAARSEEPQSSLLEDTLKATLGATPLALHHTAVQSPPASSPPTPVTATSAFTAGVKGSALVATTVKWVGIASVGGALTISGVRGYRAVRPQSAPQVHQPSSVIVEPPERALAIAPGAPSAQPASDSGEPLDSRSPPRLARSTTTVPPPAASAQGLLLSEEARLIDEARAAVASGDGAGALRLLDNHRRRFDHPRLQPEALYLRMQALRVQGKLDAAARVAERLLTNYPNGPQSAAARALLNAHEH